MMDSLGVADLVRIASHGGGMRVSANLGTDALVKIASYLKEGATLTVTNAASLGADNLVKIASYGSNGRTFFE